MRKSITFFGLVVMAGCASPTIPIAGSQQLVDAGTAKRTCVAAAVPAVPGALPALMVALQTQDERMAAYDQCMAGYGWQGGH